MSSVALIDPVKSGEEEEDLNIWTEDGLGKLDDELIAEKMERTVVEKKDHVDPGERQSKWSEDASIKRCKWLDEKAKEAARDAGDLTAPTSEELLLEGETLLMTIKCVGFLGWPSENETVEGDCALMLIEGQNKKRSLIFVHYHADRVFDAEESYDYAKRKTCCGYSVLEQSNVRVEESIDSRYDFANISVDDQLVSARAQSINKTELKMTKKAFAMASGDGKCCDGCLSCYSCIGSCMTCSCLGGTNVFENMKFTLSGMMKADFMAQRARSSEMSKATVPGEDSEYTLKTNKERFHAIYIDFADPAIAIQRQVVAVVDPMEKVANVQRFVRQAIVFAAVKDRLSAQQLFKISVKQTTPGSVQDDSGAMDFLGGGGFCDCSKSGEKKSQKSSGGPPTGVRMYR